MKTTLTILFSLILISSFGQTQGDKIASIKKEQDEKQKQIRANAGEEILKINDTFYVLQPLGIVAGNLLVFITSEGLLMVDDQWEIVADLISEKISQFSDKPLKYIINTHHHDDHIDGNKAFGKQNVKIIAHQFVRNTLQSLTNVYTAGEVLESYPTYALPSTVFKNEMTLFFDDEPIVLKHFGNGHTGGDIIIHFKKSNIIHAGDSFVTYGYPFVDLNNGGSFEGFIRTLDGIISMADENTIIIPGHGPFCSVDDVKVLRNIIQEHFTMTKKGLEMGWSVATIANKIESELKPWDIKPPIIIYESKEAYIRKIIESLQ